MRTSDDSTLQTAGGFRFAGAVPPVRFRCQHCAQSRDPLGRVLRMVVGAKVWVCAECGPLLPRPSRQPHIRTPEGQAAAKAKMGGAVGGYPPGWFTEPVRAWTQMQFVPSIQIDPRNGKIIPAEVPHAAVE